MSKYKLILQGSNDVKETLVYDPMTSEVYWEADGTKPTLTHISNGLEYQIGVKQWQAAPITNPHNSDLWGKKSDKPATLKITMGLKCNYACSYCNQAHQPHDPVGGPEDAEELIDKSLAEHPDFPLKNRAKLQAELDDIRKTNLAFDLEEHGEGISAIGIAMLDLMGRPVAVSIPVPSQRFDEQKDGLSKQLKGFRKRIRAAIAR